MIKKILREDEDFPEKLRKVEPEISEIYIKGNLDNLNIPSIAIIGSRNCSERGIKIAQNISKKLSEAGFCIISGMAKGIDRAAHTGALLSGGRTIAVMRKRFFTHISERKYRFI